MKRADYNEYLYIRSAARRYRREGRKPIMWHIRVTYSAELKQKIDELLRGEGFFPCSVGEPSTWRGQGEHIIYLAYESEASWLELTTPTEREHIAAALRA